MECQERIGNVPIVTIMCAVIRRRVKNCFRYVVYASDFYLKYSRKNIQGTIQMKRMSNPF